MVSSYLDILGNENCFCFFRINALNSSKSQEKTFISSLERKLKLEKEARSNLDSQLKETKKKSSRLEADSTTPPRPENHDACISRRQEVEYELNKLQNKLEDANQIITELRKENMTIKRKNSETEREKIKKDVEFLTGALTAMQGKNHHLENSLSSETRLKLDLFSALGDTRRQLEIIQSQLKAKCSEVDLLKAKIAEVMAVMPPQYHSSFAGFVSQTDTNAFMKKNMVDTVVTTAGYAPIHSKQNGIA